MTNPQLKRCTECGHEKASDLYRKGRRVCKACALLKQKAYWESLPLSERRLRTQQKWRNQKAKTPARIYGNPNELDLRINHALRLKTNSIVEKIPYGLSGIYEIRNTITGQIYIGSSVNIRERWANHIWRLRRGKHHSKRLQRAWDRDGEDNFQFTILESVTATTHLIVIEQAWITFMHAWIGQGGYNTSKNAFSTFGIKLTQDHRKKISSAGYKQARPYIVTLPSGIELEVGNLTLFCEQHGLHVRAMRRVGVGKQRFHLGFSCRKKLLDKAEWERLVSEREAVSATKRKAAVEALKEPTQDRRQKLSQQARSRATPYIVTAPDGIEHLVFHLPDFARENGVTLSGLYQCAIGNKGHHCGWMCRKAA